MIFCTKKSDILLKINAQFSKINYIVRKFMKNNENVSIKLLLKNPYDIISL